MKLALCNSDFLTRAYSSFTDEQHQHIGLTSRTWMKRSWMLRSVWLVNRTNRFTGERIGYPAVCVVDDFGNLHEIENLPHATIQANID